MRPIKTRNPGRIAIGIDQALDDSGWALIIPAKLVHSLSFELKGLILHMSQFNPALSSRASDLTNLFENEMLLAFLEKNRSKRQKNFSLPPAGRSRKRIPVGFFFEDGSFCLQGLISQNTEESPPEYVLADKTAIAVWSLFNFVCNILIRYAYSFKLQKTPPLICSVEGLALKGSALTQGAIAPLAIVYGSILRRLTEDKRNLKHVASVNNQTWKKNVIGAGNADKKQVQAWSFQQGAHSDTSSDEADAIAIAYLCSVVSGAEAESMLNFGGRIMPKRKTS